MSAKPSLPFATPEEYLAADREAELRSEYYAGEIVAMSGASYRHETIVLNLSGMVGNALRGKPCRAVGGNLRVRVRKSNFLYADLTVVCGEAEFADQEYLDTLLNPTVVFEILSESTKSRDRGIKSRLYEQIPSLEHYVVIYQELARVEVWTRHAEVDWLMHPEEGLGGEVKLPAIGVTLPMADLYEDVSLEPEPGVD